MKFRALFPLLAVVLGACFLVAQRIEIQHLRAAITHGPDAPSEASPTIANSASDERFPQAAKAGLKSRVDALCEGLDLQSKNGRVLMEIEMDARLAKLNFTELSDVFQYIVRMLPTVSKHEASTGESSDPEKMLVLQLMTSVIARLQKQAPLLILDWLADRALPEVFQSMKSWHAAAAMRFYSRQNPYAGLAWIDQHRAAFGEEGKRIEAAAIQGLAWQDLPTALSEAERRGILSEATTTVIPTLVTPEARRRWSDAVMTLPDAVERDERWSALTYEQICTKGWDAAASIIATECPPEAINSESWAQLTNYAITTQPEKVANFLTTIPAERVSAVLPDFIKRWTARNYNAAATWLRDSPPMAPWRDAAVAALVDEIRPLDPEAARIWTDTITDPAIHERLSAQKP